MFFQSKKHSLLFYIGLGLSFCYVPATMISPSTNIERCHKYCKKNAYICRGPQMRFFLIWETLYGNQVFCLKNK